MKYNGLLINNILCNGKNISSVINNGQAVWSNDGNLVTNGYFASNGDGWDISEKGTGNTVDFSTGRAVLTCNGNYGFIKQLVNCNPSTTYRISFNFSGVINWGNGGNIRVEFQRANGTWISGIYHLQAKTLPFSFTTPVGATKMQISFGSGDLTTGTFIFDNIVVTTA